MFCSQCGKKVMENMLFCPFCGSPIVIPDQDDGADAIVSAPEVPANPAPAKEEPAAVSAVTNVPAQEAAESGRVRETKPEPEEESTHGKTVLFSDRKPVERFADAERQKPVDVEQADPSEFKPLDLEAIAESEPIEELPEPVKKPEEGEADPEISELLNSRLRQEPVKLEGHAPDLTNVKKPKSASKKRRNTYAPVREFNPNDIFLDGSDEDYDDAEDDVYEYEEREDGGFFVRHIRGLVALGMLVIMLAILGGWSLSGQGQLALARNNLAWRASAYQTLGYQAFTGGNYLLAGQYYSQALAREPEEYAYATSAAVSYFNGNNMEKAAEMAQRAIEINPSETEAYTILLRIYPDPIMRPWTVTSLLQQGYRITGDASLNVE